MKNPGAWALTVLQVLALWILTGIREDLGALRASQGKQANVLTAVASWAANKGYRGPQLGGG